MWCMLFNFLKPSGFPLCTTKFYIQKFYMLLALRFVWISEQAATFVLYWLVSITMVESVYNTVHTSYKADYASSLKD